MEDILQSAASDQRGVVAAVNGGVCGISRRALCVSERLSRVPCEWWGDLTVPQVLASLSWLEASARSLTATPPPPFLPSAFPAFLLALGGSRFAPRRLPEVTESLIGNPAHCLEEAMLVTQETLASPSLGAQYYDLGLLSMEVTVP